MIGRTSLAQKAHTLEPNNGAVADTLGWILYRRGEYKKASLLLQEAAAARSDDGEIQFHLGMAYYMLGESDPARLALERAVKGTGDYPGKAEAQERLAALQKSGPQASTSDLEASLKQQPNDPAGLMRLGERYAKQGKTDDAAAMYEKAYKLNPNLPGLAIGLAQLYSGPLHDREKALLFAKKARDIAPTDVKGTAMLGRIALEAGNFAWAYSVLQESVRMGNDDPKAIYDLALAAYATGNVTDARKNMERLAGANPSADQAAATKRFLAMTGLEEPSAEALASESEVQKILKEQPDYVPALMAKAAILMQRNQAKDAEAVYSQVLQKYPDFAPAQKRLAAIYGEESNSLNKAYDLAMKARKTLKDDPELDRTLARISFKRKEFPYAVQLFEQTAARKPLAAQDLYYLGMAQFQSKQEGKGRQSLDLALKAGLSGPLAEEAKKRLANQPSK